MEKKNFEVDVFWHRCRCGRYFACEWAFDDVCGACERERAEGERARAAELKRSNAALRGLVSRLKRKLEE